MSGMQSIHSLIPDADQLLALEPEELAGVVLKCLKDQAANLPKGSDNKLNRNNFIHAQAVQDYPPEHKQAILKALSEAWGWLESEKLIAHNPGDTESWYFITRLGEHLNSPADFKTFQQGKLLPKELLHPRIAETVWHLFIRGKYDTAVFEAFKEVEIAVREAGKLSVTDIGVKLMRKAFDVQNGPLSDKNAPEPDAKLFLIYSQELLGHTRILTVITM